MLTDKQTNIELSRQIDRLILERGALAALLRTIQSHLRREDLTYQERKQLSATISFRLSQIDWESSTENLIHQPESE